MAETARDFLDTLSASEDVSDGAFLLAEMAMLRAGLLSVEDAEPSWFSEQTTERHAEVAHTIRVAEIRYMRDLAKATGQIHLVRAIDNLVVDFSNDPNTQESTTPGQSGGGTSRDSSYDTSPALRLVK